MSAVASVLALSTTMISRSPGCSWARSASRQAGRSSASLNAGTTTETLNGRLSSLAGDVRAVHTMRGEHSGGAARAGAASGPLFLACTQGVVEWVASSRPCCGPSSVGPEIQGRPAYHLVLEAG